jgi:hypothetical protein
MGPTDERQVKVVFVDLCNFWHNVIQMTISVRGEATPTYALIDRKGAAPFYSPTRLSEFELSRRIEAIFGIDSLIPII